VPAAAGKKGARRAFVLAPFSLREYFTTDSTRSNSTKRGEGVACRRLPVRHLMAELFYMLHEPLLLSALNRIPVAESQTRVNLSETQHKKVRLA
jgi:hypothetical protein